MKSFSDCKSGWSKEPQWENNCSSFLPYFLLVISSCQICTLPIFFWGGSKPLINSFSLGEINGRTPQRAKHLKLVKFIHKHVVLGLSVTFVIIHSLYNWLSQRIIISSLCREHQGGNPSFNGWPHSPFCLLIGKFQQTISVKFMIAHGVPFGWESRDLIITWFQPLVCAWRVPNWLFIQISIIHVNNCNLFINSVIKKSYHNDLKYHIKLNTIFGVASYFSFS